jgi:hypothetical protein
MQSCITSAGARAKSKIRGDPMGTVAPILAQHIALARQLTEDARGVACQLEFAYWRETLSGWRRKCARTLLCEFEHEAAAEFLRATRTCDRLRGSWQSELREDLRLLDDAIELLVALRNSLSNRGRHRGPAQEPNRQAGLATETPR